MEHGTVSVSISLVRLVMPTMSVPFRFVPLLIAGNLSGRTLTRPMLTSWPCRIGRCMWRTISTTCELYSLDTWRRNKWLVIGLHSIVQSEINSAHIRHLIHCAHVLACTYSQYIFKKSTILLNLMSNTYMSHHHNLFFQKRNLCPVMMHLIAICTK